MMDIGWAAFEFTRSNPDCGADCAGRVHAPAQAGLARAMPITASATAITTRIWIYFFMGTSSRI